MYTAYNTTASISTYIQARHEAIQCGKNDKRTEREMIADLRSRIPAYEPLNIYRYENEGTNLTDEFNRARRLHK